MYNAVRILQQYILQLQNICQCSIILKSVRSSRIFYSCYERKHTPAEIIPFRFHRTTRALQSTSSWRKQVRHSIAVGLAVLGLVTGAAAVDTATAQPAEAAYTEYIWNVYEADGSNSAFLITMTNGRVEALAPGVRVNRDLRSFTLPRGMCAMVKYNGGPARLRGPGTHSAFVDGVVLTVDPHLC